MAGGMQGGYPPPAPARKAGSTGILLWSFVGCGVIALLLVIIGAVLVNKGMKTEGGKSIFGTISAVPSAAENVEKVSAALEKYKQDNGGKYPSTLDALVPKYVADKSILTSGGDAPHPMEYTAPKPDAADTAVVVRVHVGDITIPQQQQRLYIVLLKNGEVDQEQLARTIMSRGRKQ